MCSFLPARDPFPTAFSNPTGHSRIPWLSPRGSSMELRHAFLLRFCWRRGALPPPHGIAVGMQADGFRITRDENSELVYTTVFYHSIYRVRSLCTTCSCTALPSLLPLSHPGAVRLPLQPAPAGSGCGRRRGGAPRSAWRAPSPPRTGASWTRLSARCFHGGVADWRTR